MTDPSRSLAAGCHLSSSKGFLAMGRQAVAIGANTFQFFSRNPRGTRAKALDTDDAAALVAFMKEHDFAPVMAHSPYILNPCSKDENLRVLAAQIITDDLERQEHLPGNYYNFHPGNHGGQGLDLGIAQIAAMLSVLLKREWKTTVLLETMTGKGNEVGGNFGELRRIMDATEGGDRLGVCLDTCHVWDAGYDIVHDLDGVLEEFDRTVGLDRLKAIHINDSLNGLGARKDRHAKLGEGTIGLEAFARIINHPALRHLPFNLETPNELPGYQQEIAILRGLYRP